MRIFVLEDNFSRIREFVSAYCDYKLVICNDAKLAIAILHNEKFDLVLLDHDLEGMICVSSDEENTGYQVAKTIHKGPNKNSTIRVHSYNKHGAEKMVAAMKYNDCPFVDWMPYGAGEFFKQNIDLVWKNKGFPELNKA